MIPLPPEDVARMWRILLKHDFKSVHGGFGGQDIEAEDIKERVLDSMKIHIRGEGYSEADFDEMLARVELRDE
jgi:hypothetical protein